MREAATVVTGVRQPRGINRNQRDAGVSPGLYARISALLRGKNLIVDKDEKTPFDVVFQSRYTHHRIQITAPEDIIEGRTGRKTKGRPLVAQFDRNLWSIPKNIRGTKITDEQAAEILDFLRTHPNCGPGRDFWEAKDVQNEARIRQACQVVESVSKDPAVKDAVMSFLAAEDFTDETEGTVVPTLNSRTRVVEEIDEIVDETSDEVEEVEPEETKDNPRIPSPPPVMKNIHPNGSKIVPRAKIEAASRLKSPTKKAAKKR